MPLNIIVKNKTPFWRKHQSKLGSWTSKHRDDPTKIEATLSVGQQFSPEERRRIDAACLHTNSMGIEFNAEEENEMKKEAEEAARKLAGAGLIIKPY